MKIDTKELAECAANGDPDAQFQLSSLCHSAGDIDRCIAWLRAASQQRHVKAMTNLGICYYFGDGIEQSHQDAWRLFQEAATLGDLSAKYYLGLCYLNGEGVSEDRTRGFEILLECASEGMPWAQLAAADCYKDGIGAEIDLFEAVSWYARAAEQGIEDAKKKFHSIYYSTHFTDSEGNQRWFWFEREAADAQRE